MLEFMLKNTLIGKPDEEVFNTVKGIYDQLGNVLYPEGEFVPIEDDELVLEDIDLTDTTE